MLRDGKDCWSQDQKSGQETVVALQEKIRSSVADVNKVV